MNFLSDSLQNYANLLVGLMPVNYIPTRCVNECPLVFIRVGISIQKQIDSHLDKTRPAALKIWSCLSSNEQDWNVKLKASLQQADRRKLTAAVLMGSVLIATLCLKPWVAFATSATVKSVPLSLKRVFNVAARRESSMHWDDTIYKKKVSKFLKWGSAKCGDCTKHPILLNNISENTFLINVHLQLSNFWKRQWKESYLDTCSAIMKYLKIWDQILLTSLQYSRTPQLAGVISEFWWKTMPKKKDYCLNFEKLISSFTIQNEHLLLLCCCFIYKWVLFAQKYTVLLSTLRRNASTALNRQQWTQ